ncbi:IclR family transcriptional regulator domain-containing protein [Roseinatronobacter sp. NSM]|uniref:IclR family transcriptional regulator domain-containing protein n=1 Tax=Roseinatronobacter sp. NSM TaxID=3457785 RepID=UPI00403624BF
MKITARDTMTGLAKGLAVIETFTADRPRQSIADAASAAGLDRATTRRCLLTLAQQGYADWDGKYFTLTPRVLRLGTACLATMPLPQLVQPFLDALSDDIGESSSVSILDGAEIVYVARAAQQKVMSIALMPGSRLPAYCTSMGRVLLAHLPHDHAVHLLGVMPLPARTQFTLTEPQAILQHLAEVRAAGYAVNDQEIETGLRSIAVPIYSARKKVIAAVNIGVSAARASPEDLRQKFLPPLLKVQDTLRHMLG